jgi:outer membrane protein TolC
MTERTACPSILAVALLLCWAEPALRADQPPASAPAPRPTIPAPRVYRAASPASTAPPAINPASRTGGRPLRVELPSTVSSDIERFVRQSGRDLPPSTASATAGPLTGRVVGPSPLPAPRTAPAVDARPGQGVLELSPTLPSRPAPPARAPGSRTPTATPPSPLATPLRLKPAPLQPTDWRFPINLATALRLSDARPLIVAAAQARVWIAEAELAQAKILWVPDLYAGFDYVRHDGGGPDFNKGILTAVSTNWFFAGGGLNLFVATTDALFQPLVARQVLNSRHWLVQSAKNDALLQTADAYFMVHQYRGMYAGTLYCVKRGQDLVEQIATLSRDLVSAYEVDRARNVVADLEQQAALARQQWRVQSARLTKVLRLDPRAVVEPLEHDHLQITLIDPGRSLDDLMPVALTNRPELASRRALVAAAELGVRRETARPLMPMVLLNGFNPPGGMLLQAGIFGLGPNASLNQWTSRDDVSIQLVWQFEHFGLGNLARIKAQRGLQSQAIIDLFRTQDRVAEEVNQALARLQSAAVRVVQADRALRTGLITLNGATEGLKQIKRFDNVLVLISRPQEAIYALQLLNTAFDDYFTTVAEYNRAQFDLFHALGYPAQEVTSLRPPGDILPVDTARPQFLPPVGHGPPPATR